MLREFTVRNFRCFDDLTIQPLKRVNLIAGMNGTGKTALLEALFLHVGPHNPQLPLRINAFRGIEPFGPYAAHMLGALFHWPEREPLELLSVDELRVRRSLTVRLTEPGEPVRVPSPSGEGEEEALRPIPGTLTTAPGPAGLALEYEDSAGGKASSRVDVFGGGFRVEPAQLQLPLGVFLGAHRLVATEDVERFSELERKGRQRQVLTTLKVLEPRLKRLAVLATGGTSLIYGDVGIGELVPLQLLSEGLGRLLTILAAIGNAPGGTVLIDEVENGLHHSALVEIWKAIGVAAGRSRTQVFATTHSGECIEAAHRAFAAKRDYDFRLHRLDRIGNKIEVTTYDKESLESALKSQLEVR
jgi:hypothetical protein